ncbi:MAG: hypothetical protein HZA01_02970 [Nitrospinae bacterium]|nr:hypothetical protein [Nitrospinota bacterium]
MLTKNHYRQLKEKVSLSPYKHGPCWELCGGLCCREPHSEDWEYVLEFFPFEEPLVSRRMFPRLGKYEVQCLFPADSRSSCDKTLFCHLAPSYPAFERGAHVGVTIDPEIESCPLMRYPAKVSIEFMRAAFSVWKEVLSLLPPERVTHYKSQFRRFLNEKKIKKVWKFC